MVSSATTIQSYRVRVGHIEVTVLARDESEAIALARRELARQMPRFYDLIRALDSTKFELQRSA